MSEVAATGRCADLPSLLGPLLTRGAVAMLEHTPTHWLNAAEQDTAIQVLRLPDPRDFAPYRRGRVFDDNFELRWEPDGAELLIGYVGSLPPESLTVDRSTSLGVAHDRRYDLWGRRVRQPQRFGYPVDAVLFGELRLPRLLPYPAAPSAERVYLRVREYFAEEGGPLVLYRFCGLESVAG